MAQLYNAFLRLYTRGAILFFDTLLFFVLLNVPFFIVQRMPHKKEIYPFIRNNAKVLSSLYPGMSLEEINDLFDETWARKSMFEPFTQFKESPYHGRYVNVTDTGFRVTKNQGLWPPDQKHFNVFLFGGSTTFGYGVPDDQTIASYLQDHLSKTLRNQAVSVYNFGRGGYYSTQERILFEKLIGAGFIPNAAIFIDGVNDFQSYDDRPTYSDTLAKVQSGFISRMRFMTGDVIREIPLVRFVSRFGKQYPDAVKIDPDPSAIRQVLERYIRNKRLTEAVAAGYAIQPVFVWQPAPTYHYDLRYDLMGDVDFGNKIITKYAYPMMAKIKESLGNDFLWCADLQTSLKEPLYVDRYHYSAKMSNLLALNILNRMKAQGMIRASENPR